MSIKLSIIIPCYNGEPYIHDLLECLDKQITDEVEVILIDDGSKTPLKLKKDYSWISHFWRQKNSGISISRNKGLELAKGELINFVDADDMLADNYVEYVLGRLSDPDWDYMDLSWKSLEDNRYMFRLRDDNDSLPNPSASTRVFKRSFIGDVRFPEKKDAAEDEDFTRHLQIRKAKHICATEIMYYYRVSTPGSNYKRYMEGRTKTKRIGYYYKEVTKDMTWLIDEIKKTEEIHEVFLFTHNNELPELEIYANISMPTPMRVAEMRGEPNDFLKLIPCPYQTQVVLYKSNIQEIGGIETFIYNFCNKMHKYYDITVIYDNISNTQLAKLVEICPVMKNSPTKPIECDTLILNSILDAKPGNIEAKKVIQMTHCLKQGNYRIPQDRDVIVNVSQASKDSFGDEAKDGVVIHNMTSGAKTHKALLLVSAMRVGASDKQGNDDRCIRFAKMLDKAEIKYIWLYFGDKPMVNEPNNMFYCGARDDVKSYIAKADYLIQLSGAEAYSYSILESLELLTPVIVTPLAQNEEIKIKDGVNAYIVPFEVEEFDVKKILKVPRFTYYHDNDSIIKQWKELLGDTKPTQDYKPKKDVEVIVQIAYWDLQRNEDMKPGMKVGMKILRALELQGLGFVRILT